ncbi:Uncharacterized protein SCF082_LOCUS10122 [Durusdinium trenchii]|uniref:Uncharacterized protein n=1 Tax=Durusdinium trenchii TaxID=1381693 RepID=A0ABP0J3X1_9DINO
MLQEAEEALQRLETSLGPLGDGDLQEALEICSHLELHLPSYDYPRLGDRYQVHLRPALVRRFEPVESDLLGEVKVGHSVSIIKHGTESPGRVQIYTEEALIMPGYVSDGHVPEVPTSGISGWISSLLVQTEFKEAAVLEAARTDLTSTVLGVCASLRRDPAQSVRAPARLSSARARVQAKSAVAVQCVAAKMPGLPEVGLVIFTAITLLFGCLLFSALSAATSTELGDRSPAPEEGQRENFLKLHEIGRRDCKLIPYPEIPNLTRKSQTYSISFAPKQSTDWEVNKFVMQTKKAGTGAGVPPPDFGMRSTYQDLSRPRSLSELKHALPAWTREREVFKSQPSMIKRSLSQDTFAGEHSGFKAIGDRFVPIHELSVDLGSRDFWYSTYGSEHRNFFSKPHKDTQRWRKRHGPKILDQFFQELNGPTVTKSTFLKPLNLLGTDLEMMAQLREKLPTR